MSADSYPVPTTINTCGSPTGQPTHSAMRTEQEIFDELVTLCTSAGYVHALAALCFRDTVVGFAEEVRAEDMAKMVSLDRLIRTELMTLTGLMLGAPIDFALPAQETIEQYVKRSEELLFELHQAMLAPASRLLKKAARAIRSDVIHSVGGDFEE